MKKQQYKVTYEVEGNKYTLFATAGSLRECIDRLLAEGKKIVGIDKQ